MKIWLCKKSNYKRFRPKNFSILEIECIQHFSIKSNMIEFYLLGNFEYGMDGKHQTER